MPFIDNTSNTAWHQLSAQDKTIRNIKKYISRNNSKSFLTSRNIDIIESHHDFNSVTVKGSSYTNFNSPSKQRFNSKEKLGISPSRRTVDHNINTEILKGIKINMRIF